MGQTWVGASVHVFLLRCSEGLATARVEEGPEEVDISSCPDVELLQSSTDFLESIAARDENNFGLIADLAKLYLNSDMAIINIVDPDGILRRVSSDMPIATSIVFADGGKGASTFGSDLYSLLDPLRARDSGFDFYTEIPLRSGEGTRFGSLIVLSREARDATDQELAVLRNLARLIVERIELRLAIFRHLHAVTEAFSS